MFIACGTANTLEPTVEPTLYPTLMETNIPSISPSYGPTIKPSLMPTDYTMAPTTENFTNYVTIGCKPCNDDIDCNGLECNLDNEGIENICVWHNRCTDDADCPDNKPYCLYNPCCDHGDGTDKTRDCFAENVCENWKDVDDPEYPNGICDKDQIIYKNEFIMKYCYGVCPHEDQSQCNSLLPTTVSIDIPMSSDTQNPTSTTTMLPTYSPITNPTITPSLSPSENTINPAISTPITTDSPSKTHIIFPSLSPLQNTIDPTIFPEITSNPPSNSPSNSPSITPIISPTHTPSKTPIIRPSKNPTHSISSPTWEPTSNETSTILSNKDKSAYTLWETKLKYIVATIFGLILILCIITFACWCMCQIKNHTKYVIMSHSPKPMLWGRDDSYSAELEDNML